ncbi:MAG: hypothetical protein ACT4RN_23315 [Pseudonocardia sp.]
MSLLLAATPAFAGEEDRHATCSTREAPTKANFGEAWVNVIDDGPNWKITNIHAKIRAVDLPITGDNQIDVRVLNLGEGPTLAAFHSFERVANADVVLTANVYPFVTVPKGKLAVRLLMVTGMDSWPKNCSGAGLVF